MPREYHTRCRLSIMNYLKAHKESRFSASDIYESLKNGGEAVNLATIYRNLDKLIGSGLIIKYKSANDDRCKYQYVEPYSDCENHLHMQCSKCARLIHLECGIMDEISKNIKSSYGFSIECKNSLIVGICENCRTS